MVGLEDNVISSFLQCALGDILALFKLYLDCSEDECCVEFLQMFLGGSFIHSVSKALRFLHSLLVNTMLRFLHSIRT